jgi:hypothetical protein
MHAVESLGLSSYPPAYLSEEAQSNNKSLLHGANFASGAAGYLDATAALYVRDVLHALYPRASAATSGIEPMPLAYIVAGRHVAEPAGGVLPGVPVAGGRVGRPAARPGADVRVHLRGERRHQRLRAELLREPDAERRLHARPVRRRAHAALHLLRRGTYMQLLATKLVPNLTAVICFFLLSRSLENSVGADRSS